MSKVLISFSGHKLADEARSMFEKEYEVIEEIFIPFIDFEKEIHHQLTELTKKINFKLDGSRTITLIMPGHSTLSALIYNFIFGLTGHPPDIYMLREDDNGIYMPFKSFKGREIKKAGRLLREEINKNRN